MQMISCCALQVKPGGRIPDKGKKITVHVKNIKDLSRDVIKVCDWIDVYAEISGMAIE